MREERTFQFSCFGPSGEDGLIIREVYSEEHEAAGVEISTIGASFECFVDDLPAIIKRLQEIVCAACGDLE